MPAGSTTPSPQRDPLPASPPARRAFKVVLIGGHAVGKSSLRSRWLTSNFSPAYRATIGADFVTRTVARPDPPARVRRVKGGTVSVAVWDTAGQERFRSLGRAFYRGADALILAYDVSSPDSLRATEEWYRDFCAAVGEREAQNVLLAAVGCKSDLLTHVEEKTARAEAQRWFARLGPHRSTEEEDDAAVPLDDADLERSQRPLSEAPSASSTARSMSTLTDATEQQRPGPSVLQVPGEAGDSRSSSARRSASSTSTATAHAQAIDGANSSSNTPRTPRVREDSLAPSIDSGVSRSSSISASQSMRSSRSLRSINLIHPEHSPFSSPPRERSTSTTSSRTTSHGRTPSGSLRAASRLSWAAEPATPPRSASASGLNVGRSLRGRYDSTVSVASTSGGASMYHTPRGSTLFDSESSGAEEEEHGWREGAALGQAQEEVEEEEEDEDGAKTPTRKSVNGEQHVDVQALQEGLQKANLKTDEALNDDVPMPNSAQEEGDLLVQQQEDSDEDYRMHAPGLPHVPSGEPIPFPVSPAAPLAGSTMSRSRSKGSKRNSIAGSRASRPNSWFGKRGEEGQKTPSRSRTASAQREREEDPFAKANASLDASLEAPNDETSTRRTSTLNQNGANETNRQTLYEAPPLSMGSTLRPPRRTNGTPNRDTLFSVAPSASEGDSTLRGGAEDSSLLRPDSPLTDADFDAAASDDEEPWPVVERQTFSVHLTSAKLGQGVDEVFDQLVRRASERWEVEEWDERRALKQTLHGKTTAAARAGGRNWWGGARSAQVALTEEEREREQVRRGIRIAAGKEPRGYWKSCCGS